MIFTFPKRNGSSASLQKSVPLVLDPTVPIQGMQCRQKRLRKPLTQPEQGAIRE
jgi:hypothetical protein